MNKNHLAGGRVLPAQAGDGKTRPVLTRQPASATWLRERASLQDVTALFQLEQKTFATDLISMRSWRKLIASPSACVTVMRRNGCIVGATAVLTSCRTSVARLYSIAVDPQARGQGVARLLLDAAVERARDTGASVMRLETRVDNQVAQALFEQQGFTRFGRESAYYQDGADALRYQKPLWNGAQGSLPVALQAPFYAQTLDFTCGPCALLMAMAALDSSVTMDRVAEIRVWREATTVFMAAGHGGCGPFGLAASAIRRGFAATVYAPTGISLFVDSVRDPLKKDIIALVEADFRAEIASTAAAIVEAPVSTRGIVAHLRQGRVPVVLISLWRRHREKGPHWVVVTGFDGANFQILDPIAPPAQGESGMRVSIEEFQRMSRYGRRRQSAAVILSRSAA